MSLKFFLKTKKEKSIDTIAEKAKEQTTINYLDYFFESSRNNEELSNNIHENLKRFTDKELYQLSIDILSISFVFLRSSSESINNTINYVQFYKAVVWHLSDSVHNIPTHLYKRESLIYYISEFFIFLHSLEKCENKPISDMQSISYHSLFSFKRDWNYLYLKQ